MPNIRKPGFLHYLIFAFPGILFFQMQTTTSYAFDNLRINPFEAISSRMPPETTQKIRIDKDLLAQNKIPQSDFIEKIQGINLNYEIGQGKDSHIVTIEDLNYYIIQKDHSVFLSVQMPPWQTLTNMNQDLRKQKGLRGWLKPYEAQLILKHQMIPVDIPLRIEIPDPWWGRAWGIAVVLLSFVVIYFLKPKALEKKEEFAMDLSQTNWEASGRFRRFFLYPLNFAITPIGTYSISLAQILLWTYVTIFGIVYVYWLTGRFINITDQVLMLLGIGGGTALAAKINAVSKARELPAKYMNLIKKERFPKLSDLITIDKRPNIYKFQMLAFTLLTAYIVLGEILKEHAFPEIPNSLVTLMGISGAVYLGNEFSGKNIWDDIETNIAAIEEYAKGNNLPVANAEDIKAINIPEKEKLINMLKGIYG